MAITDEIPRSRITLTYRTTIHGEPEDITLPFRVLIMGDLSKSSSKDRKVDLDKRQIRRLDGTNLNQIMSDMDMSLKMSVPNRINPKTGGDEFEVTLPIRSTKSFQPMEVAKGVPKIKALLLLKKLLREAQANFDNRKEFRALLRQAAASPDSINALIKALPSFDTYKLPRARLQINVPEEFTKDPALEVRRFTEGSGNGKHGELIERAAWNKAMPVKPGRYRIETFSPDTKPWSASVDVQHDTTVEVTVGSSSDDSAKDPATDPTAKG